MKLFGSLLITAVLVGTSAYADAPAKADVDKFLTWFDSFAQIAVDNQNDCPKMAAGLNKSIDDNQALLTKAKAAMDSGMELPDDARQHMQDTAMKLAGAVATKCKTDQAVMATFKRLPGRSPKQAPPAGK